MRVRRLLHPTRFLKAGATCHERILNETCFLQSNEAKEKTFYQPKKQKEMIIFWEFFYIYREYNIKFFDK